jgi:ribulose-phosphate 3-epimerase
LRRAPEASGEGIGTRDWLLSKEPVVGYRDSGDLWVQYLRWDMSDLGSRAAATIEHFKGIRPAILPSLLLCDFSNLKREVERLEESGVEALHLDVMDGHFVPNLSYGMPIVESLRRITSLALDVHLMISNPAAYADRFVAAGADCITFHIEAVDGDPEPILQGIRNQGVAAGLAINPATPMDRLLAHVSQCDIVLVMSVPAGFGGQAFHPVALERLQQLRRDFGPNLLLEIDGGINVQTVGPATAHGADLLVVGSAIFREADYCQAMTRLQREFHQK